MTAAVALIEWVLGFTEALTLQQQYDALRQEVQLKSTGATVHKLNNLLAVAMIALHDNDSSLFKKCATDIRKIIYITNKSKDSKFVQSYKLRKRRK